jgi:hypothetical protein
MVTRAMAEIRLHMLFGQHKPITHIIVHQWWNSSGSLIKRSRKIGVGIEEFPKIIYLTYVDLTSTSSQAVGGEIAALIIASIFIVDAIHGSTMALFMVGPT